MHKNVIESGKFKKSIIIHAKHRELIIAAVVHNVQGKNEVIDLLLETPHKSQKKGNIYRGVISSLKLGDSLEAVFVDYGEEKHGFLPLKEIAPQYFGPKTDENSKPSLKQDQTILVQVTKEAESTKGAALTTYISLAGSYLVLMPNDPAAGGVSRRIYGQEREELKEVWRNLVTPPDMGVIVRTAGLGRQQEDLQREMDMLTNYWKTIQRVADSTFPEKKPILIHKESDAAVRAIRDYLNHDIDAVIIDDVGTFEQVKKYVEQIRPDFVGNIHLFQEHTNILGHFQVDSQIESAFQRELRLPSGGRIVIDHTEMGTVIDVNSASAKGGSNIEETALQTNLETALEIARQLRLRDIGGIIVVDFIDMQDPNAQQELVHTLQHALAGDRARIAVAPSLSEAGVLEIRRQRLRGPINELVRMPCTRCQGQGFVRHYIALALSALRALEDIAKRSTGKILQLQLSLESATFLLNQKRADLQEIEQFYQVRIVVLPNLAFENPQYHIDIKGDTENLEQYEDLKAKNTDNKSLRQICSPILPSVTALTMQNDGLKWIDKTHDALPKTNFLMRCLSWLSQKFSSLFSGARETPANTSTSGNTHNRRGRGGQHHRFDPTRRKGQGAHHAKTPFAQPNTAPVVEKAAKPVEPVVVTAAAEEQPANGSTKKKSNHFLRSGRGRRRRPGEKENGTSVAASENQQSSES